MTNAKIRAERRAEKKLKKRMIQAGVLSVALFGLGLYSGLTYDSEAPRELSEVTVTVKAGQTVWEIQSELTPDENMREMIHHIGEINDRRIDEVKPGEELIFLQSK